MKLIVYLSKGPDKERKQILERREISLDGQVYGLTPTYLNPSREGLVKRLVDLRNHLPKNTGLVIESDRKYDGLELWDLKTVLDDYEKGLKER